jgi:hypothetical protein
LTGGICGPYKDGWPRYIHNNPVKRGLCQKARDWRWSSARFYVEDGAFVDPLLPKITPLPAELWAGP